MLLKATGAADPCIGISILAVVLGILAVVWHFNRRQCPKCGTRGQVHYRYERTDGGPDRRYNNNPYECSDCGWVGYSLHEATETTPPKPISKAAVAYLLGILAVVIVSAVSVVLWNAEKKSEERAALKAERDQIIAERERDELETKRQRIREQKAAEQRVKEEEDELKKASEKRKAEQAAERKLAGERAEKQRIAEQKVREQEAADRKAAEWKAEEKRIADKKLAEQKAAEQKLVKDEEDAARKLKLARSAYIDGKRETAIERLREIVKNYPNTKAGAQAKEFLKTW